MLMARAKPDGLPTYLSTCLPDRPLNMYRRSLSLPSLLLPLGSPPFRLRSFESRSSKRGDQPTDQPTNHRIRLRAVNIRRRHEFSPFVSDRVCWTFVDEFGIEERERGNRYQAPIITVSSFPCPIHS